jgi:hypothetical protein
VIVRTADALFVTPRELRAFEQIDVLPAGIESGRAAGAGEDAWQLVEHVDDRHIGRCRSADVASAPGRPSRIVGG